MSTTTVEDGNLTRGDGWGWLSNVRDEAGNGKVMGMEHAGRRLIATIMSVFISYVSQMTGHLQQ